MSVKRTGFTRGTRGKFGAALLCLALLPAAALAVTEGEVEAAPDVELGLNTREQDPASYLPDEDYFGHEGTAYVYPSWDESQEYVEPELYGDYFYDMAQNIALTEGEIVRARRLLTAYQAGEAAGDGASVLEAAQNVALGVYALDLAQYDGEQAYVILPGTCLSDEQLLAVIDAYAQLGLTFDPEALNCRNSMRGGGVDESRFLTAEEYERYHALRELIERGVLSTANVTPERIVSLDERYFYGCRSFALTPYRPMTDGELVARLVARGVERIVEDFDALQREARDILTQRLAQPLSMELTGTTLMHHSWMAFDDPAGQHHGEGDRWYFKLSFGYTRTDGVSVRASCDFDKETLEFVGASASEIRAVVGAFESEQHGGATVTQDAALAAAAQYAQGTLGLEELTWYVTDDEYSNSWGLCYELMASLGNGEWLTLYVGCDDALVHGTEIDARYRLSQEEGVL